MTEFPQFQRDMLACPPTHGGPDGGVHRWIFRVARQLHAHREPEDIFELLTGLLTDCGRKVPAAELLGRHQGI